MAISHLSLDAATIIYFLYTRVYCARGACACEVGRARPGGSQLATGNIRVCIVVSTRVRACVRAHTHANTNREVLKVQNCNIDRFTAEGKSCKTRHSRTFYKLVLASHFTFFSLATSLPSHYTMVAQVEIQ